MSTSIGRPSHDDRIGALARLLEAVHEGMYIGALTADPDADVSLIVNQRLKTLFAYAASTPDSEVRPFAADRFVDPSARDRFIEELAAGGVKGRLLRLRRIDGVEIWVEVTACGGRSSGGPGVTIEALVRDATERRAAGERERGLYQELVHAERMAALGQTISGVAHELNNPLATIIAWCERLLERPADEIGQRGLGVILAESQRAARIVRNLLTVARKRQSTRALVDLNQVVLETLALRAYEQRLLDVRVATHLAPGLPHVFVDGQQMQQVLLNLLINAEQAMVAAHGRGTLVLRTAHDAGRGVVTLEVTDDGPGVPPEIRDRIFDPFFTTKDASQGTGLGLTVAGALVQEHGGTIQLAAREGPGASFVVTLPLHPSSADSTSDADLTGTERRDGETRRPGAASRDGETRRPGAVLRDAETRRPGAASRVVADPARQRSRRDARGDLEGTTVLVVEHDEPRAAAAGEALREAGAEVDHASDGEHALARVRQQAYDAIVCDLQMPGWNGMVFYRAMAAATPELARRVIFVTDGAPGTDAARFLDDNGCPWLARPFRFADLVRTVRDTLA